jgi:four helix bundle protein
MKIESYKDLVVWQRAMQLVVETYKLSEQYPKEEKYGLISQMRRAAIAIPSNIAEGHRRRSKKDFKQFLIIANASAAELET